MLADVDVEGAERAASELDGDARAVRCDVTVAAEVVGAVEATAAAFGGLDVLVNNAGVEISKPMVEHGDEAVDLWITEFGFTTCAPGSSFWCVSEAEQAEYTEAAYRIARERWPFVKAVINSNLRTKGTTPEDREAHFGLLRRDFTPKPAYEAFERALSR